MNTLLSLYIFTTGLILGSFYHVVGIRLPVRTPFLTGRSQCPHCQTKLQPIDLIPLFSYLLTKGACRHCCTHISLSYPLVETLTGVLFLFSYIVYGWTPSFFGACLLISLSIMVTVSDLRYMLIPDRLLIWFTALFTIYRFVYPLHPWYSSVSGAFISLLLIAFIIILSKGGMGAGDMKLLGVLGILLGTQHVLVTFFIAVFIGTVTSLLMVSLKRSGRKDPVPFGPSIVSAAVIVYFYGENLVVLYLSSF
ncbi:prepilin peptidase [Halobacillus sp. B29]|uniref:prepilin peptidase n=1 Tax=Halobacillus sp. B29 TaxID=3457432 RepID=UPI003FCDCD18